MLELKVVAKDIDADDLLTLMDRIRAFGALLTLAGEIENMDGGEAAFQGWAVQLGFTIEEFAKIAEKAINEHYKAIGPIMAQSRNTTGSREPKKRDGLSLTTLNA